jgi:hypothetical protein
VNCRIGESGSGGTDSVVVAGAHCYRRGVSNFLLTRREHIDLCRLGSAICPR